MHRLNFAPLSVLMLYLTGFVLLPDARAQTRLTGDLVVPKHTPLVIPEAQRLVVSGGTLQLENGAEVRGGGTLVLADRATLQVGTDGVPGTAAVRDLVVQGSALLQGPAGSRLQVTHRLSVQAGALDLGTTDLWITAAAEPAAGIFLGPDAALRGEGRLVLAVQAARAGGFANTRAGAFPISGGGTLGVDLEKTTDAGVALAVREAGGGGTSVHRAGALFFTTVEVFNGHFHTEGASRAEFYGLRTLNGDLQVRGPGAEVFPPDGRCGSGNESGVYFFSPVTLVGAVRLHQTDDPALACPTPGVSFAPGDQPALSRSTVRGPLLSNGPAGLALHGSPGQPHHLVLEGDLQARGPLAWHLAQHGRNAPCEECGNRVIFGGSQAQLLQYNSPLNIQCVEVRKNTSEAQVEIDPTSDIMLVDSTLFLSRGTFITNGQLDMNAGQALADGGCVRMNADAEGRGMLGKGQATGAYHDDFRAEYKPATVQYVGTENHITGDEIPGSDTIRADATLHILEVALRSDEAVVSLGKPLHVENTLYLSSGDLNLSGFDVNLGATGRLVEAPGSTIRGALGRVLAEQTLIVPDEEDTGGLGAVITSPMSLGLTTVVRGHAFQIFDGKEGIRRFYDITPAMNTQLDATLVFSYDASELNGLAEATLELFRSEDDGATWTRQGGTVDTAANTVKLSGVEAFSRWTLGPDATVGVHTASDAPTRFRLDPNYPNPFSQGTTLGFALPRSALVTLQVFNLLGQRVRVLLAGDLRQAGAHRVWFDGLDQAGRPLRSGVYFYQLQAGTTVQSRGLLLRR